MRKGILIPTLLAAVALPAAADDCRYSEARQETVDAAGLEAARIIAEAGFLVVEGRSDLDEVRIRGQACASRQSSLDEIELEVGRSGTTIRIEADTPDSLSGWSNYARLDLTVEVPRGLAIEIRDGSGYIEVIEVASAEIEDGSGEIEVEGIDGDLSIDDGSGEIDVRDVAGRVSIEDGSGEIEVREVGGDVEIREDGSGSISIEGVRGSVRVREDGSGSIRVRDVDGDFTVVRDGSGGISYDRIGGRVRLP